MKKIFKLLILSSIFMAGFIFTGCMKEQIVDSTQDQWYKYAKTVDIPLSKTGSEESPLSDLKGASLYVYYLSGEGLKVAIQAESEQSIEILGGLVSYDQTITAGAVYNFENFTDTKWAALVLLSGMSPCDEPKVSATPDQCLILGGDEASDVKIQWKKVLANVILEKLLGISE